MQPDAIREFLSRDWGRSEEAAAVRWADRRHELGPAEGFRIAAELYEHVRRVRPDWPSAASRRADFEHHKLLSERLRAVRCPTPG